MLHKLVSKRSGAAATLSTVKKSQAKMPLAWQTRNSFHEGEGFVYPDSRCRAVILMDQPAQSIGADNHAVTAIAGSSRLRRLKREAAVRTFRVVVPHVLSEDPLQMTLPEDQQVIQALPARRLHQALGEGVRLRRADRRADDAHALGAKHLIVWAVPGAT